MSVLSVKVFKVTLIFLEVLPSAFFVQKGNGYFLLTPNPSRDADCVFRLFITGHCRPYKSLFIGNQWRKKSSIRLCDENERREGKKRLKIIRVIKTVDKINLRWRRTTKVTYVLIELLVLSLWENLLPPMVYGKLVNRVPTADCRVPSTDLNYEETCAK